MIGIDVCHDGEHRLEMNEGRVTFVGFCDKIVTLSQPGVRIRTFEATADNEGRIETSLCQDAGHKTRCGRLAVGTSDGNRVAKAHQLGEHFCPTHDGHQLLSCRGDFWIGSIDRAGDDYGISITNVVRSVADEYGSALLLKAKCLFVRLQVRALHSIVKTQHDLGYSRHT